MAKYDFVIDTSDRSSTGLILSRIAPGSTVLEFGCANGRMTRYMKEELSCQVYIVEYDESAFNDAVQYARDGICDDIMSFSWAEKFAGIRFDAVIFADVLEHLSSPEMVVAKAAELLAESGSVHISVPNITHNDVLLKAYDERFDYTDTGLLDDTHIHFWGMKNLSELAQRSGLTLRSVVGTYCDTGATEQYAQAERKRNVLLENLLKQRACGEVYQFVVELDKKAQPGKTPDFKAASLKCGIYADRGNDFTPDDCIMIEAETSENGSYKVRFELTDTAGIKRVRFDPIEGQGCILCNVSIREGAAPLDIISNADCRIGEGYLFLGDDPMVYAQLESRDEPVTIEADIILAGEKYIRELTEEYFAALGEIRRITDENADVTAEKLRLVNEKSELESREKALQEEIAQLQSAVEECRSETSAYTFLVNQKDIYLIELERELSKLRCDVHYYENLWFVRLRRFAARVVKGMWKRVKRILGKGER